MCMWKNLTKNITKYTSISLSPFFFFSIFLSIITFSLLWSAFIVQKRSLETNLFLSLFSCEPGPERWSCRKTWPKTWPQNKSSSPSTSLSYFLTLFLLTPAARPGHNHQQQHPCASAAAAAAQYRQTLSTPGRRICFLVRAPMHNQQDPKSVPAWLAWAQDTFRCIHIFHAAANRP
jgi:hypothetical protein